MRTWSRAAIPLAAIVLELSCALRPATTATAMGHEHAAFQCTPDGLASSPVGCELLGKKTIRIDVAARTYWHLARLERIEDEEPLPANAILTRAEDSIWLSTIGPEPPHFPGGTHVASVGPLAFPTAKSFEVVLYRVVMPPGSSTGVHTHPGPEAWYILSGEQCLETPDGVRKAGIGQSMWVEPNVPMRLSSTGAGVRRALFIVIHDSEKSWAEPSAWQPTGVCDGPS